MIQKIKQFAHATRVLSQFHSWGQLNRLAKNGIGLQIDHLKRGNPQTVLVIAPHPDDETFGCGGALALHRRAGDEVHVLVAADGSRGTPTGRRDPKLVAIRQSETEKALAILGGATTHFWGVPDGALSPTRGAVEKLAGLIEQLNPTRIYVPWLGDNHEDHQAAFAMLEAAFNQKQFGAIEIWQYEIWSPLVPNRLVPIKKVLPLKERASACYKSQRSSRDYQHGILALNNYRGALANIDGPAEAFFALPAKELSTLRTL